VYKRTVLSLCGVAPDQVEPALRALKKVWAPYVWRFPLAESVAALHELRLRGVPIGVVSNASGQIEGVLATQGVCQVGPGAGVPVKVIVDSEVVGVMKPDPRIFEPALEVLDLPPGRVAYVGDSVRNDVRGAEAAGLVPLHLDPHGDHYGAPHERIASIHDVLAMV
jgi:putative hydrolase of the HAD superfamily